MRPFIRSPYNYDMDAASLDHGTVPDGLSLTQQEFAEDSDINVMMKRFGVTGQLPQNVRQPSYGDFSLVGDYRSALHAVMEAQASFDAMPADVRARFQNNPALFVDFCSNEANAEEAKKMGLVKPSEAPVAPVRVEVVSPSSPSPNSTVAPPGASK